MLRSSVELLPEDVRQELERKLIRGGFADYVGLAEWLETKGFEISKSSVHRYGKKFEEKLRALKVATDQAKAIAEASEDDAGELNDAIIRLVQTKMFELLVDIELNDKSLAKIGQAVAKLSQAAVRQKKWAQEMEDKVRKQAFEDVANAVDAAEKDGPMSADRFREIIKEQYGV